MDSLPIGFSWVPVRKNVCADDELELRNIPYVDEGDHDDTFLQEYVMNYEGIQTSFSCLTVTRLW